MPTESSVPDTYHDAAEAEIRSRHIYETAKKYWDEKIQAQDDKNRNAQILAVSTTIELLLEEMQQERSRSTTEIKRLNEQVNRQSDELCLLRNLGHEQLQHIERLHALLRETRDWLDDDPNDVLPDGYHLLVRAIDAEIQTATKDQSHQPFPDYLKSS